MLSHLSIRNFALIDRLDVELDRGLVVVTGETGAGKSIVFDAMALLVGGRASADFVRAGEDEASVQGQFEIDGAARPWIDALLAEAGIESGSELVVRRTVSRRGANRVYVNDALATVALLSRALDPLVEVVGQHEQLTLVRPDTHRSLIDRYGKLEPEVDAAAAAFARREETKARLEELRGASRARAERLEFLRFQRDELRALDLREGEYAELERTLARVRNLERLREGAASSLSSLVESDDSAVDRIGAAIDAISRLVGADETLSPSLDRLAEALATVEDVAAEVRRYARGLDGDAVDIDAMEARHEVLRKALRKYATDEAGLLARTREIEAELATLEDYDGALALAERDDRAALAAAEQAANGLESARASAAVSLFDEVHESLAALAMPDARLVWKQTGARRLTRHGWDGWEILFVANHGEPAGSIGKIASGGELSRLMLAIKTAAAESDRLQTYTFDEVDTGIGGGTAEVVGRLLAGLASERQVICVTHHAQIACFADAHLVAEKAVSDGRTRSSLRRLASDADRRGEIGRMIGGLDPNAATAEHAAAMLAGARRARQR